MVNKLPGLTRNDDVLSRTITHPPKGRVVTGYRGPDTPGLRPAASPVDMYARPERPAIDNRLASLMCISDYLPLAFGCYSSASTSTCLARLRGSNV